MALIRDIVVLFLIGSFGWVIFNLLRLPTASLLGSILFLGTLRALEVPLPTAPNFLAPGIQVFLGLYIGAKVTRETVKGMKELAWPSAIVSIWALSIVFVFGILLARLTWLDTFTAMLSSSIGGLPEMTMLALATNSDIAVVVIMQSIRMIATLIIFPILFTTWFAPKEPQVAATTPEEKTVEVRVPWHQRLRATVRGWNYVENGRDLPGVLYALVVASAGGYLFLRLGVPAGAMVGAMFAVAGFSLAGARIKPISPKLFPFMLVGIGIMVSDNISPDTIRVLASGQLILPLLLTTFFIFLSSLGITYLLHRVTGWDLATSFLVASPGGFTVMTVLAVRYNKDPFKVSMLHLVRLLAIKSVVPLVFTFLI